MLTKISSKLSLILGWAFIFAASASIECMDIRDIIKDTSLSETDRQLLQKWGFKDQDTLWLIDNIRNPFQSTTVQEEISRHKEENDVNVDTPEHGFELLDYVTVRDNDIHRSPTEADMLLLVPQLINRGYDPNIPIGLRLPRLPGGYPRGAALVAPLIFLAVLPGYERLLTLLLTYPEVNVNVTEGNWDNQCQLRAPDQVVDQELVQGKRTSETPLHYIIRAARNCSIAKCKQAWLRSLELLLQRRDVDLASKVKFKDQIYDMPADDYDAFALADGDQQILEILFEAKVMQDKLGTKMLSREQESSQASTSQPKVAIPLAPVGLSGSGCFSMPGQSFELSNYYPSPDAKKTEGRRKYLILPPEGVKMPEPQLSSADGGAVTRLQILKNPNFNYWNCLWALVPGGAYLWGKLTKKAAIPQDDLITKEKSVTQEKIVPEEVDVCLAEDEPEAHDELGFLDA
jgi:hypothetical protein